MQTKPKRPSVEKRAWETMRGRCFNRTDKDFHLYGGRGITVCKRWCDSVEAFLIDMGPKPSPKHQLDRKDNDGDYSKDNCRWATPAQQAQNRRTAKLCALSAVLIRYMHRRGISYTRLGHAFGVNAKTVQKICVKPRDRQSKVWGNALKDLAAFSDGVAGRGVRLP